MRSGISLKKGPDFRSCQVTHFNNPKLLAEVSESLGAAMVGLTM